MTLPGGELAGVVRQAQSLSVRLRFLGQRLRGRSGQDVKPVTGADIVIDYKKNDFENILHDYDVVLNSQDGKTLEKSLRVLRPGGKLISISGPPDPDFAKEIGAPWFVKLVVRALSYGIRRKAKRRSPAVREHGRPAR